MGPRTLRSLVMLACLGLLAAAPSAAAHATAYTPDGKVKFVFGNLGEPVYTFMKTGLDLGIVDNRTGAPINGLVPSEGVGETKIHIILQHGTDSKDLTPALTAQFGKPGWITAPLMYTAPGLYPIHITGTINGTTVDQTLQPKHAIADLGDIMWPRTYDTPDKEAAKIAAMQQQMGDLSRGMTGSTASKSSAGGVDGILLLGVLGVALVLVRRRNA